MAARAFSSQKPALQHTTKATATRAAHASGHRSASDTPSSGRERRRQGKAKMLKRIAELEARVCVLLDIIAQLSSQTQCGPMDTPAEFFDIYGDMDPSFATHVATQTDISVDLRYPDVFIQAQDIFVKEQDLPVCAAESHLPPPATAHADAAAGFDAAHAHVSTTSAVCQSGNSHHDVTAHAAKLKDFNSQSLVVISGPSAFGILEPPLPDSGLSVAGASVAQQADASFGFNSQSLARSSETTALETLWHEPRLAPDDDNSRHRGHSQSHAHLYGPLPGTRHRDEPNVSTTSSMPQCGSAPNQAVCQSGNSHNDATADAAILRVFNSQSLAVISGPSANENLVQPLHDSGLSVAAASVAKRADASLDFNSQSLAISSEPTALALETLRQAPDVDYSRHREVSHSHTTSSEPVCEREPQHVNPRQAPDVGHSGHREESRVSLSPSVPSCGIEPKQAVMLSVTTTTANSKDFNSLSLAYFSGPSDKGILEQPPPDSVQSVGQSGNSQHDVTAVAETLKDFNSQSLAILPGPSASVILEQSLPDSGLFVSGASAAKPTDASSDFNSQSLAFSSSTTAFQNLQHAPSQSFGPSERECQRQASKGSAYPGAFGNCEQDFKDDVAPIIGTYCKRRKPTNNNVRTAAKAIIRIARRHGISQDVCCSFLKDQSMALWCAASDMWGMP